MTAFNKVIAAPIATKIIPYEGLKQSNKRLETGRSNDFN